MKINVVTNNCYWDEFYQNLELSVPSQFCVMVATECVKGPTIVELGCGNGRDSFYFAGQGHNVCAIDLSKEAVEGCRDFAEKNGLDNANFVQGSIAEFDDLERVFIKARGLSKNRDIVAYSRFVMHSIDDVQESAFLEAVGQLMLSGEKIYFEFRSEEDAKLEKTYGNHYRRFVKTDKFIEAQTDKHGFELSYERTGQGMAKYKSEDPYVSRLIFEKK